MLRLDATTKKSCLEKLFKFKNFIIKQAFFINENFSSRVKVRKVVIGWVTCSGPNQDRNPRA